MRALALLLLLLCSLAAVDAEAPLPVSSTVAASTGEDPLRAALRKQAPPWYDAERDTWKRIEVKAKPEPKDSDRHQGSQSSGFGAGSLFALLMYLLIAALVVWVVWQVMQMRSVVGIVAEDAPRARPKADIAALPFALEGDPDDPDGSFEAALRAGDWRRALVWLYAGQLFSLDRAGVLRLTAGKTNRAYVREVAAAPTPVRSALGATVEAFERVYFGHAPASREEVLRLRELDGGLRKALARDAHDGGRP